MSTAKAALQIDAKQLASNLGPKNIRVNLISAGPYAEAYGPAEIGLTRTFFGPTLLASCFASI